MNTTLSTLVHPKGYRLAYHKTMAKDKGLPEIIFVHGFRSDMNGIKPTFLEQYCAQRGLGFLRFDLFGHGASEGEFLEGTIGTWLSDVLAFIDLDPSSKKLLIGSSLGGWLVLLAALQKPEQVEGIIGLASAPDFTEDLIYTPLSAKDKATLSREGKLTLRHDHFGPAPEEEPFTVTQHLIEEARQHLLLRRTIPITNPVLLIHGMKDMDVPYSRSLTLAAQLASQHVQVILQKNGDHRLSTDTDLNLLKNTLELMLKS